MCGAVVHYQLISGSLAPRLSGDALVEPRLRDGCWGTCLLSPPCTDLIYIGFVDTKRSVLHPVCTYTLNGLVSQITAALRFRPSASLLPRSRFRSDSESRVTRSPTTISKLCRSVFPSPRLLRSAPAHGDGHGSSVRSVGCVGCSHTFNCFFRWILPNRCYSVGEHHKHQHLSAFIVSRRMQKAGRGTNSRKFGGTPS